MPSSVDNPADDLPELFLARARTALLYGDRLIDFESRDVISIASTSHLKLKFVDLVKNEINDLELNNLIIGYINDISESLDEAQGVSEAHIDLIDKAGFPVATGAVGLGIALLVSTGIVLGPLAVFGGGLFGLGVCGAGRTVIKLQSNRNKASMRKLKRLLDELR